MERENALGVETGCIIEELILNGAHNLVEEYKEGFPLITENLYENGRAVYIATQYFSKYLTKPSKEKRDVLAKILSENGITPYAELTLEDCKKQSALITNAMQDENGDLKIITVTNTDYESITDTLILPNGKYKSVEENKDFDFVSKGEMVAIEFSLGAMESLSLYNIV